MSILDAFKFLGNTMTASVPESFNTVKSFTPMNMDLQKSEPVHAPIANYENPLALLDATGYKDKPASLSYDTLRKMATRNAVVGAVITTRINQVSSFTKPARFNKDGVGYEIITRNPHLVPSEEQKRVILAIELFLENCGFDSDDKRDGFDQFVRKIVRDSLTYDQACFEVVPDRKGRPAEVLAVDAATIRAASENNKGDLYSQYTKSGSENVSWVQVIDGVITTAFTSSELAFGVRNPRTDINLQPYGFSELEQLIHQITSHLYAEEYNSRYFSQGGTTKGILNIKSDANAADRESIESFKRQWKAQVSGLYGAWKTPILQVPSGLEYINVSQSNREMEFEKWMNYLINVCCAVFQIDPAEVNFPNNGGVGGTGASMMEGSNEQRLKNSKDKGLRPLLRFVEELINKFIVTKFSDDFVFTFVGIDSKTDKEIADLDQSAVKVHKTVNEIRAEHDQDPIDGGDIILDGVYVQYMIQQQQQEQQQQTLALQALQQQQQPQMEQPMPGQESGEQPVEQQPVNAQNPQQEEQTEEINSSQESKDEDDPENYTREYEEDKEETNKSVISIEINV